MNPEYASPEQLKGEAITTASDMHSLGVVLYALLCGRRPFAHLKGRRPDEFARAVCEEEPPQPSTTAGRTNSAPATKTLSAEPAPTTTTTIQTRPATLRRQLEGDLDNIVAKALQKEPARRYPSILALSEDFRRHSEGLPVSARRDTRGYRTGKFVRRNKVGVAAPSLVLPALVGGLVATTWQAQVARAAERRAQTAQKQAERTSDFLQKILLQASPMTAGGGKDVKITEVLDQVGATMDQELVGGRQLLGHRQTGHEPTLPVPSCRSVRQNLDLFHNRRDQADAS